MNENRNIITQLVHDEGLPAWKRHGTGPWRALNIDIDKWLVDRRNKFYHDKNETSVGAQANR